MAKIGLIPVNGSGGEVMAPMAGRPGEFYRGKPVYVRVTEVGSDESDPIEVREGLVGVKVRTIFDHEQLECVVEAEGDRAAYAADVANALEEAGKPELAELALRAADGEKLALYFIEAGKYELVS